MAMNSVLGGNVGLTGKVVFPRYDGPVGLEPQTMAPACGDSDELRVGAGTLV